MIEIHNHGFPSFLKKEFEKMIIPGEEYGFAISFSSAKIKECASCGQKRICAFSMVFFGEEYSVIQQKSISPEIFQDLCKAVPKEVKKTGFIFCEDILDGETYLVKWAWGNEKYSLVLCNPRENENDSFNHIANHLDELMRKVKHL